MMNTSKMEDTDGCPAWVLKEEVAQKEFCDSVFPYSNVSILCTQSCWLQRPTPSNQLRPPTYVHSARGTENGKSSLGSASPLSLAISMDVYNLLPNQCIASTGSQHSTNHLPQESVFEQCETPEVPILHLKSFFFFFCTAFLDNLNKIIQRSNTAIIFSRLLSFLPGLSIHGSSKVFFLEEIPSHILSLLSLGPLCSVCGDCISLEVCRDILVTFIWGLYWSPHKGQTHYHIPLPHHP